MAEAFAIVTCYIDTNANFSHTVEGALVKIDMPKDTPHVLNRVSAKGFRLHSVRHYWDRGYNPARLAIRYLLVSTPANTPPQTFAIVTASQPKNHGENWTHWVKGVLIKPLLPAETTHHLNLVAALGYKLISSFDYYFNDYHEEQYVFVSNVATTPAEAAPVAASLRDSSKPLPLAVKKAPPAQAERPPSPHADEPAAIEPAVAAAPMTAAEEYEAKLLNERREADLAAKKRRDEAKQRDIERAKELEQQIVGGDLWAVGSLYDAIGPPKVAPSDANRIRIRTAIIAGAEAGFPEMKCLCAELHFGTLELPRGGLKSVQHVDRFYDAEKRSVSNHFDVALAQRYWREAADAGVGRAQFGLAFLLATPHCKGEASAEEVVGLLEKAAQQTFLHAMFALGMVYAHGRFRYPGQCAFSMHQPEAFSPNLDCASFKNIDKALAMFRSTKQAFEVQILIKRNIPFLAELESETSALEAIVRERDALKKQAPAPATTKSAPAPATAIPTKPAPVPTRSSPATTRLGGLAGSALSAMKGGGGKGGPGKGK